VSVLLLPVRILFGLWMLANGLNHFFLHLWPEPAGHAPLAIQLMDAFRHSGLLDVAMAIELVAGALILLGRFTPVALCVLMPVSTCALFWSAVLDHQLPGALLALVAFALNGALMLCFIDYYRGALQRRALSLGELRKSR
jgi:putative oxidoreductase